VQSTKKPGEVRISARADGLPPLTIKLTTAADQ
jgi:hypothetical protein